MIKQKKKVQDDEFEDEEEEDDSLDDGQEEEQEEAPTPVMKKPFNSNSGSKSHKAGDVETVLVDLGNGTLRPSKKVWANETESATSDDPLIVLMASKLFPQLVKE
jgi:hypothetical protein